MSAIYFCPDFDGDLIYKVSSKNREAWDRYQFLDPTSDKPFYKSFRKPSPGMIQRATNDLDVDINNSWSIGDRLEDEACAQNAGINFMWADIFRQRFLPCMYEVKNATKEQVAFLENINP